MKLHPWAVIIMLLSSISMVLINDNPVLSMVYLVYIYLFTGGQTGFKNLKKRLEFTLIPVISLIIINPLVSREGGHVLYRGMRLPVIGRLIITWEGIGYGLHMSLKLITIYMIFMLIHEVSDKDEIFSFFSGYAYKLTLILSMGLNISHRVLLDVQRVKEVMTMRGMNFNHKNMIQRLKSYYPLLKVILISSMEGSIERAEALYSKGYGQRRPTRYRVMPLSVLDGVMIGYTVLLAGLAFWGKQKGIILFRFYPYFSDITQESLYYIGGMGLLLISHLLIIWRWEKWKLLQYRI